MEQLVRGGVPTVLYTDPPTPELTARFRDVAAVGIASCSRAMSPAEMDERLPALFDSLAAFRPQFVHYKVCSTFDSSPTLGNIGRAIDVGARMFKNRVTPLVVGAPSLGRYCAFGNLFARSGLDSPPFRLDRHPTMSCHPSTPMDEADLRVHLARQTERPIELIDLLTLEQTVASGQKRLSQVADGAIALFDVIGERHLTVIGRVLAHVQRHDEQKAFFVVGSSAIESALTQVWRNLGFAAPAELAPPGPVDQVLVVSGSCSPVTDRQIEWAVNHGFAEFPLDAAGLLDRAIPDSEISAIAKRVQSEHDRGRSVIVHTSRGQRDPRVAQAIANRRSSGLGVLLGRILNNVLAARRIPRVVVAGGDTAGVVARTLGIEALEMIAPHAPGAPLCRAHASVGHVDGVELIFKGGQVGHDDYFRAVLHGQ
jgi:uncharacterized protein YgbK (DUF1537 family)